MRRPSLPHHKYEQVSVSCPGPQANRIPYGRTWILPHFLPRHMGIPYTCRQARGSSGNLHQMWPNCLTGCPSNARWWWLHPQQTLKWYPDFSFLCSRKREKADLEHDLCKMIMIMRCILIIINCCKYHNISLTSSLLILFPLVQFELVRMCFITQDRWKQDRLGSN